VGEWRRPDLPQGALKDLNDALHDLHGRAGARSSRYLADQLRQRHGGTLSHTTVHKLFTQPELPELQLMLWIVELLAERVRRLDPDAECDRFDYLWNNAYDERQAQRRRTAQQAIPHAANAPATPETPPTDASAAPHPVITNEAAAVIKAVEFSELYNQAFEQLGSEKAPVRLGGLYALERLAQDNPGQRQIIVNVLCAYLRMPYTPPVDQAPAYDAPEPEQARFEFESRTQERQVRLAAQRILATHLRPSEDPGHPAATFWPDIDLDLIGATLIDFDLSRCRTGAAVFDRVTFVGAARFVGARFAGDAVFDKVTFAGTARFAGARFDRAARFVEARFAGAAWLAGARFAGDARFVGARFAGGAWFVGVTFAGDARFDGVTFAGVTFAGARFASVAWFDAAVTFGSREPEQACWVRLDVPDHVIDGRAWPVGWGVVPTVERPAPDAAGTWGQLAGPAQLRHLPAPHSPDSPP
jgi:uncharacterized protein YjbI with pentapeptide repeats